MSAGTANVTELVDELLASYDAERGPDAEFWGKQFDLGLAWVHHPPGEGGLGADRELQAMVQTALSAAGVPDLQWRAGVGVPLVAPTLAVFGTPEQRARHLRPIFTGEEIWCQLFSEPGAGSDLAGLATRAVETDGTVPTSSAGTGDWTLNGQKVWNSMAHAADFGILIARSDPDLPKHKGMTYFIVPMDAEGVEVRPLRQITGEAEFDEVFLTDVVVGDDLRIGDVGNGWAVTLATLANERMAFNTDLPPRGRGSIGRLLETWKEHGSEQPHLHDRVVELAVRAEAMRLTNAEAQRNAREGVPSAAFSFLKLVGSELDQEIYETALDLMGPEGMTYENYEMRRPDVGFADTSNLRRRFLFARALTIAGGSSEIQRTIIADRVLGLPREPQPDKDRPWREIPRN